MGWLWSRLRGLCAPRAAPKAEGQAPPPPRPLPEGSPERAALARNAYLRAWRGCGVPLEGSWHLSAQGFFLSLSCQVCGGESNIAGSLDALGVKPSGGFSPAQRATERLLAARITERGCAHLGPLLREEPPELEAIAALELLAGG